MIEQTIKKEHMEAMQVLADTNLKISAAKNSLFKLQEDETTYLEEREKRALERIHKLFTDSESLITQIRTNYKEVNELLKLACSLAEFVSEAQENLHKLITGFKERNTLWLADIAVRENAIEQLQKKILIDQTEIANEKKNIAQSHKKISEEKKKIADAWAEIEREITRLKEK